MATLNLIDLLKGTSDPVMSGVVENIITTDQLTANLPFVNIGLPDHLTWNREKALPAVSKPSSGGSITADNALAFDRVTAFCRRFVIDQDIDNLDAGAAGGMVDAKANAIAKASKSLGREYGQDITDGNPAWTVTVNDFGATGYTAATIVVGPGHDPRLGPGILKYTHSGTTIAYKAPGDAQYGAAVAVSAGVKVYSDNANKWVTVNFTAGSAAANGYVVFTFVANGNEIDGMSRLASAAQTISASTNGDAITLATLDQLADLVTDTSGQKVYIMHSRTRRATMALIRAAGGALMGEYMKLQFGTGREMSLPTYNDIPILRSDFLSITETQGSSSAATRVYCATLSPEGGLCGIYSVAGSDDAGAEVISQGANGITVVDIGTVQNADAKRVRVKAYWGLASKTERGLAVASGITS